MNDCSAYHPVSNVQDERTNQTLKRVCPSIQMMYNLTGTSKLPFLNINFFNFFNLIKVISLNT